jgi:hypothetical protein
VLFKKETLEGMSRGTVTLAFRRWPRALAKVGGTQRTPAGVIAFDAVEPVTLAKITDADAKKAGASSREELLRWLATPGRPAWGRKVRSKPAGRLWRIRFHLAGADPRIALRSRKTIGGDERAHVDAKLARLDRASAQGPWTRIYLALIAKRPAMRAPSLAASLGMKTAPFKRNVRKLKELGLTISLPVGYRLSPRGRAYLRR